MGRPNSSGPGRFVRVTTPPAAPFEIVVDGASLRASAGQSVLAAILAARKTLRHSAAAAEPRAGFCLMGACQDCWIWREDGVRLRACTTAVEPGMRLATEAPPMWPGPAGTRAP